MERCGSRSVETKVVARSRCLFSWAMSPDPTQWRILVSSLHSMPLTHQPISTLRCRDTEIRCHIFNHCSWGNILIDTYSCSLSGSFLLNFRGKSVRVFVFGDYELLCNLYGISGASGEAQTNTSCIVMALNTRPRLPLILSSSWAWLSTGVSLVYLYLIQRKLTKLPRNPVRLSLFELLVL